MWSGRRAWLTSTIDRLVEGEMCVMPRMVLACSFMVALLSVSALSAAQAQPPAQFEVIEHYATLVSGGAKAPLRLMFSRDVSYAEHALFWSEERGTAALPPLYALIDAGARLEVDFHAAESGGDVIITRERLWLDGAAEALTPLRSTGVYVLDGDRILSITRVLDAEQGHALMREVLVGTWQAFGGITRIEFDADGLFRYGPLRGSEGDILQSGTYVFEGELVTTVRDDATQACVPGDVAVFRIRFAASDSVVMTVVEDTCERWGWAGAKTLNRVVD